MRTAIGPLSRPQQEPSDLHERLRPVGDEALKTPRSTRPLEHWATAGLDPAVAAETARANLIGAGVCLPMVWLADALVVPVVRIERTVVSWRAEHRLGALLDRTWWRDRGDAGFVDVPPSAVKPLAFLTVGELSRCRGALGRLRGTAPTIAVVPAGVTQDTVELARCDYYSIPVVEASTDGVKVVVTGDRHEHKASSRAEFHLRLRGEQLFDLAVRADAAGAQLLG